MSSVPPSIPPPACFPMTMPTTSVLCAHDRHIFLNVLLLYGCGHAKKGLAGCKLPFVASCVSIAQIFPSKVAFFNPPLAYFPFSSFIFAGIPPSCFEHCLFLGSFLLRGLFRQWCRLFVGLESFSLPPASPLRGVVGNPPRPLPRPLRLLPPFLTCYFPFQIQRIAGCFGFLFPGSIQSMNSLFLYRRRYLCCLSISAPLFPISGFLSVPIRENIFSAMRYGKQGIPC